MCGTLTTQPIRADKEKYGRWGRKSIMGQLRSGWGFL